MRETSKTPLVQLRTELVTSKKELQQSGLLSILSSSFSGSTHPPAWAVFPIPVWCYSLCSRFCTVINPLSWFKVGVLRKKERIRTPWKWSLHRQARMSIGRMFLVETNRLKERLHQWETKQSQTKFWIIWFISWLGFLQFLGFFSLVLLNRLISGPEANCHSMATPVQLKFSWKPDREWSLDCAVKVFPPNNQGCGELPGMWSVLQDTQAPGPDDLCGFSAISISKNDILGQWIYFSLYLLVCFSSAHFFC